MAYSASPDQNITYGNDCSLAKGFNKICVDPNTVCSQVAIGFKKCLCDRNYGVINGQCKPVPTNLFVEDFVNKTILQGRNITIDYQLQESPQNLDNIEIEIIPSLPNNIVYSNITGGIRVFIFNTEHILKETFMVRVRAEFGRVKIQDSTVVSLYTPPPTDLNITFGNECGVDKYFNKICVDPNTVCSEVSIGFKKCLCDRNYGVINGQCKPVPTNLFVENFVNKTFLKGQNITIDYQLQESPQNLDIIVYEIIPILPNNVAYIYITGGIKVLIFNTDNLFVKTFMVRITAYFGDAIIQDSTLVHLHTIESVIEDCPTSMPATDVTTNVKLGDECGLDNDIYKICIDPDTVCSQKDQRVICQCDKNHAEIEGKCVEIPNKLFSSKYEYLVILANIDADKVLNFDVNVTQKYLRDTKLELIPQGRNIEVIGIENNQVQVIVNDTRLLQSEVIMLTLEAIYGGVKIYDSMLFKLEIVLDTTFNLISTLEELPNGTRIGDLSFQGFKDFEFVNCPQFFWNETTIYTNQKLDRDTGKNEYNCKIKATVIPKDDGISIDVDQCTIRDVGDVRINIDDINDNPPVFSRQSYSGKVKENDPEAVVVFQDIGGQIVKITTTDRDIPPNTNITYSISGGDDLPFSITNNNRDAVIMAKTNFTIDKETKDTYTFIIEATDGINKNSATVSIKVDDVNEPAKFTKKNYTFDVSEDDSNVFVGHVTAIDEDKDENYRKNTYSILSGSFGFFQITQNGSLYLVNTAGQKQTLRFELVVSVSDESLPDERMITNVTIHVTDVNESPKFNESFYNFLVLEGDACKTRVGQVGAYDVDFKDTIYSSFEFSMESQEFRVDPVSGVITCKNPLDYENKTRYELEVMAIDRGSPPLNSTTKVVVELLDDNDNEPILDVGTDAQILCSNIHTQGKLVALVRASDKDSGSNGQLRISITTYIGGDIFGIDDNGLISVNKDNNVSCDKTYTIGITCSDNGEIPLSVKINLTVTVTDQGITGLFTQSIFSENITENNIYSNNQIILDLNQYIVDPTTVISIEDTKADSRFSISNKTVIVNGIFDREIKSEYRIILKAVSGGKSDIALLKINNTDVNDNPPVIDNKGSLRFRSLSEDVANGSILAQVEVSDKDEGENAQIAYSLLTPDVPFIINSTGFIKTSQPLDRETNATYFLQVSATDGSFTDTVDITVEVSDVNDNPPVIQEPKFKIINVAENRDQKDQKAILIKITDPDTKDKSILISLNNNCPLSLTNNKQFSTELIFRKSLDYEEQTQYECVITATDEKYSTNKTLVINVVDVNDNSPVFHQIPGGISVNGSMNSGDILVDMINATDADSTSNGEITFSVKPKEYYEIDNNTGEIRFIKLQPDSILAITITATDGGIPPRSTEAKIDVTILNAGPTPEFIGLRELTVTENKVYPHIYTVNAYIELDDGEGQCEFNYSVKGGLANFEIDEISGNISLNTALDREEFSGDREGQRIRLRLVIVAKTKCGNVSSSASTTLFITIEDENDNTPECLPQPSIHISQSSSITTVVGKIQARDKDEYENGIQSYFDESESEYFNVNKSTGIVALEKKFQTSRKSANYTMAVQVGDPSNHNVCHINIIVYPDNDNGPIFSRNKYTASLDITAKKGEDLVVNDLNANDKDNDTITYSLDPDQGFFLINSSPDGPIITLKSDIEVGAPTEIVLKVYAVDDVHPIKTGTCTIQITVEGQTCIQETQYNGILEDADTATLFQILFYTMISALSLCVVLLVIVCYKWRTTNREKTQLQTYYKPFNRRPRVYDEVARPNEGYDAVNVAEDERNFESVLDPYYSRQVNPIYVRASFMERSRLDNLSPRSAVFDDEPVADYM